METREIKFLFHNTTLEHSFVDVIFSLPKEQVDNLEQLVQSEGLEAFITALPISIVGNLNFDNMINFQILPDVYTMDN